MNDLMRNAFQKAGLPSASVAFAAACHDLARLALNRQSDPARAVHVWLGMAAGTGFREQIREFLADVATERASHTKSDGDADHNAGVTHVAGVPSPSEAHSDAAEDRDRVVSQAMHVPLASEPDPAGADQSTSVTQRALVPPAGPSPRFRDALTQQRERSAAVMSGIYIPDHRGGQEAFDDLKVAYYERTLKRLGRLVGQSSVAYNLVKLAKARRDKQAFVPDGATSANLFSHHEMIEMHRAAQLFAGSGLISLPDELRSSVLGSAA
jgi:hypothetical protein